MARENVPLIAFNRGIISKLALARIDIKRTAMSAEEQTNWMPRVLGSMMLRPGWQYILSSKENKRAFHVPFIFSSTDFAALEMTDQAMRIIVDDEVLSREDVATTVTSGDFSASTGWNDQDSAGATSTITGGKLELVGTKFSAAAREQELTIAADDQNVAHGLRIVVDRGPVTLRIGSTSGADDLFTETTLGTGTHSLVFTPTGAAAYIRLSATAQAKAIVDSVQIESDGEVILSAPWAESDLRRIRYDQSADVIYLACKGYPQYKIERRPNNSWSIVLYQPVDGPFRNANLGTISLTPSALVGDITLTASRDLFKSTHVGALFRLKSIGQRVIATITGDNQFTGHIRVTGVGASQRSLQIIIPSGLTATLTVQRSVGEPGAWVDVATYSGPTTVNFTDGLDNQEVYYRFGVDTGDYSSGSAQIEMGYANGGIVGVVRITGFTSSTSVSAAVLQDLGNTSGTTNWSEGEWSDRRGYPSSDTFHEGRLWWAGKSKIIGSISDAFEGFDPDYEGDAAPINRSIGSGPVDNINWLGSVSRLLIGTDGAEWSARSSSLDEPLTATNFNMKSPSTQGSAEVAGVKIDNSYLFVQKSQKKLFKMQNDSSDVNYGIGDYSSVDLMELCPEVGQPGILRLAVQRQPDTRTHCLLGDGTVAVLISQPAEEVLCFMIVRSQTGFIEDVFVLPGVEEDAVYYQVRRVVAGETKRYLEKWALETECQGGELNKQADSFVIYDDVPTTTITGLAHLKREEVVIWADGKDMGKQIVSESGSITLPIAVSKAVIGLEYRARFKSAKLAYAAQMGTALTMKKKIDRLGLILANTHYQGLKYGDSFDYLDDMPQTAGDAITPSDTVWEDYDDIGMPLNGDWDTDSRLCLEAVAPRPCTVLAAIVGMRTHG